MENRKQITEVEILARLKQPDWGLPPLVTVAVETFSTARDTGVDAIIELGWKGKGYRFATEVRRLWTPKTVSDAADQIQRSAERQKLSPLLVVPFLGGERLSDLEARGVSGIDLCGNGVVVVPGELLVFRSGSPNQFRSEGQIKNVYRGASAVVARVFLIVAEFPSVGDVLDQIRSLGGEVTLPTVSKVCKSLEQDLVIERKKTEKPPRKLRVIQPEKLLDLLRNSYTAPDVTRIFVGKFSGPLNGLPERIQAMEKREKAKTVITGASSVAAYAVMAREPLQTFYCTDITAIQKTLGQELSETERFANVKFLETQDESVYFDRRPNLLASPVQTFLELATGEKREKETAEQVRRVILSQISAKEVAK